MTHHELAELLRDHVARDEPPAPLPYSTVDAGRRRLRIRRLALGGGAIVVIAAVATAILPRLGEGGGGADSATDPASEAALDAYDVHRMPVLMDERVREVLRSTVPDLGGSTFTAYDAQQNRLPEQWWEKASSLSVEFGPDAHVYEVTISHAPSEAEGDPNAYCANGLDAGYYLTCTVETNESGDVIISKLQAVRADTFGSSVTGPWTIVTRDDLADAPLRHLWFEHAVKVVKSKTLITLVEERVRAMDHDPASAAFTTPVADLARIGTDPQLVMPPPPRGKDGCVPWALRNEGRCVGSSGAASPSE